MSWVRPDEGGAGGRVGEALYARVDLEGGAAGALRVTVEAVLEAGRRQRAQMYGICRERDLGIAYC